MKVYAEFIDYESRKGLKDFFEVPEAFNEVQLARINKFADEAGLKPSYIRTESGKRVSNPDFRSSKVCWVPKERPHLWVYKRMGELANELNKKYWNFNITGMMERIQIAEYSAEDSGHFDWHVDLGSGLLSKRKISISVLLSDPDDYDGGDMQFFTTRKEKTAARKRGTAVMFPSYMSHRVTPVTRGVRRSMVIWVSGPPFA